VAEAPAERFTALPWAVWGAVTAIVVTSTTNAVVLGAAAVGCWVTMGAIGGRRAAVTRLVAGTSLALAAIWVVLGVAIHRDGLGGQVVWFLPSWSSESGGEFGGAVTSGQLHLAAARCCQSLAIVAVLGVLAQAVPATGWLRPADVVWGRATRVWAPLLCLAESYAAERNDRVQAIRSGFVTMGTGASLLAVTERARAMSDDWSAQQRVSRPAVRGVVGLVVVIGLVVWWAVSSIDPSPMVELTGLERTLVALGTLTVVGVLLHGSALPRPSSADAVPLIGAAAVAVAWFARGRTGDQPDLAVNWAQLPPVPLVLVLSLAALPLLAMAVRARP
jgi:hypothetical protein